MKKKQNYKQKLITDLHGQVDEFDEAISEVVNDLTPDQRAMIETAMKRLKEDFKMEQKMLIRQQMSCGTIAIL